MTEDDCWIGFLTESIAPGSKSFIEEVKKSLGFKAQGKSITAIKDHYQLRENASAFGCTPLQGSWPCKRSDAGRINTDGWRYIS